MKLRWWTVAFLAASGCSSQVPSLTAADLPKPRLRGLAVRALVLTVTDERSVTDDDRRATEARVSGALREALRESGIEVRQGAPNRLALRLRHPEQRAFDMDPSSCVEMLADMKVSDGAELSAKTLGCAEIKNLLGISYGADTSLAFRQAGSELIQQLNAAYDQRRLAPEPPRFQASAVVVPAFSRLRPRRLALTVTDELSQDGSVGQNLRSALERALETAGIELRGQAPQHLSLTLTHVTGNVAGRDPASCLEISAEGRFADGTAVAHGTYCQGVGGPTPSRVLGGILELLDREYSRARR